MRIAPVSAVIPCYRCESTIERAVVSVATQSWRPAELILVDDGSPDRTPALLDELRERFGRDWIRVIRLPENVGSGSTRNAGWAAATQPFVAFLDSDDAWHPRKIEIQHAWMEANPDVAVSGHGARQLSSINEVSDDPGVGEPLLISRAAMYASNQFITPSVMLRREISQRFEPGKRYMEDYLLWLEIAESGQKIVRLPQILAYTFKAPFGEAGLSAQPWKMELGELATFASLRRKGHLGVGGWLALTGYSVVKFLRRILMLATGYSPSGESKGPAFLYAWAYLVLTQAMTALLILAGLIGNSELAAEFGVVQAATLATFFAFSGNARNLILTERASVRRDAILAGRMVLLLPLAAGASLLCAIVGGLDPVLVALLVSRRAVEWITELYLSECELLGRRNVARTTLALQLGLLAIAASAMVFSPAHLLWALAAWALLPAIPLVPYVATGFSVPRASLKTAVVQLMPHFGATAASGMSLYAFRALLVLLAGKSTAGLLFAAFAIGSFPGSMFANVLGATVSLHEERLGRGYLPKALWVVTLVYLAGGVGLVALNGLYPDVLATLRNAPLFWAALGWSLLGGVVMLIAQRVRLRLIALGDGRSVFGADLLMHIYLIAAVPALYAVVHEPGLAYLYFLNAALALVFYACALRGELAPFGSKVGGAMVFATAIAIFMPVFFLINGRIFNPLEPVVDSGGILSGLPLPVSLVACSAGILIYGRFARTAAALWTIFGLLFLMLVSTAIAGGDAGSLGRAKMLLLLQILLPTFGLVLGSIMDPENRHRRALAMGILCVVAFVVPVQLAASWLHGSWTLRHSAILFGVYQHLQYVPVVLACGYALAFQELWDHWRAAGKFGLGVLYVFVAMYAVASHSILAMFVVVASVAMFGARRFARARDFAAAAIVLSVLAAFAAYHQGVTGTMEYRHKFSFLVSKGQPGQPGHYRAEVASYVESVQRGYFGRWNIHGVQGPGTVMVLYPTDGQVRGTIVIEGELSEGALEFKVIGKSLKPYVPESYSLRASVSQPGPFRVEFLVDPDAGDGNIWIFQPVKVTRAVLVSMTWMVPRSVPKQKETGSVFVPAAFAAAESADAPAKKGDESQAAGQGLGRAQNISERFADWALFGRGIVESPGAFLFGHAKPLAREQRSSAHNFYIDFAYTFGVLALLPLLALIAHTARLLWIRRQGVLASDSLFLMTAVVAFLVLVESNLKVSLRQPYPGIAIFFLWGLLLSQLREPAGPKPK